MGNQEFIDIGVWGGQQVTKKQSFHQRVGGNGVT